MQASRRDLIHTPIRSSIIVVIFVLVAFPSPNIANFEWNLDAATAVDSDRYSDSYRQSFWI